MPSTAAKIMILIDQLYSPNGGTEQQLLGLLGGLDRRRFTAELVVLYRKSSFVDSADLPVPTTCLDLSSARLPDYWIALAGLVRRLRRDHFALVHTLFPECATIGPFLARSSGLPHVTSRRDLGFWYTRGKLIALRMGRRWTRHWLANSYAVRRNVLQFEGAAPERVLVIPNAVDTRRLATTEPLLMHSQLSIPADSPVIVLVANLRPVKGVDVALRALGRLPVGGRPAHLVCIGEDSQLRTTYDRLCDELGIADRVHFIGHRPRAETARWLAAADIALNASYSEGLCNAICEAMALGRPVVATMVGGNPELIADGESGLLVPSGNHEAMAAALGRLMADVALARSLGEAGRLRISRLGDPQHVVDRYERVYAEILDEGVRRG